MTTALYIIWACLPLFFFGLALWGKLEKLSGSQHLEDSADMFKQGLFVLACVGIAVAIDRYFLADIVSGYPMSEVPYGVYRVILLPIVLIIGAKILGPTKYKKLSTKSAATYRKKTK